MSDIHFDFFNIGNLVFIYRIRIMEIKISVIKMTI